MRREFGREIFGNLCAHARVMARGSVAFGGIAVIGLSTKGACLSDRDGS